MTIALMLVATTARADIAPVQVFTDAVGDGPVTADQTPAGQDLIAGYIGETARTVDFVWQVADLPDPVVQQVSDAAPGVPEAFVYYWDFNITRPDGTSSLFELSANSTLVNWSVDVPAAGQGLGHASATIAGNCTNTANVISCSTIPGSIVTLSFDPIANTITAHVRRQDLLAQDGTPLAVDGAQIIDYKIFDDISACTSFYLLISGNFCDTASMDGPYQLGTGLVAS